MIGAQDPEDRFERRWTRREIALYRANQSDYLRDAHENRAHTGCEAQGVPSWDAKTYGLVSLLEMLRFFASDWNEIIRELDSLGSALNIEAFGAVLYEEREKIIVPLQKVADKCTALGLEFSASYAADIINTINSSASPANGWIEILQDVSKLAKHKPLSPQKGHGPHLFPVRF